MSKKFFRPPPGAFENDDDDESEEEESEDEEVSNKPSAAGAGAAAINADLSSDGDDDDDDDDDDDEEDSEEDEEEEDERKKRKKKSGSRGGAGPPPPRKKSRPAASAFFDMEAEASDDDDEEEDYNERGNKDKGEQMDEEARELIRQQDRRRAMASGGFGAGERSVEAISREIEERHRRQQRTVDISRSRAAAARGPESSSRAAARSGGGGGGGAAAAAGPVRGGGGGGAGDRGRMDDDADDAMVPYSTPAAVAQQSLMPSVSDPSLWMVSCPTGKEQELVFQLMNKCAALARQGRPLGISAAIAAQSKGKIYVESFSEPAVLEAIQGVRGIMQSTMRLVPIGDMTTVMTVVSKKKPVRKNEWVRMTRGHYKGDLALVKAVKESGLKCVIQCVPRLDHALPDLPPEEARIRRKTVRPPQKFFNPQEVAALGRTTFRRQKFPGLDLQCDNYDGNYFHDGYLLKEMTVGSMVKPCTEDDPPTLDELQAFQRRKKDDGDGYDDDDENEGSKVASSLLEELSELQGITAGGKKGTTGGGLMIGDTVEVIEGDLVGMHGKLVSLDGTTVKVKPNDSTVDLGGTSEIEFLANQVRKFITVGAHVKVTEGRYANETGTVVAVEHLEGETDLTAVVMTDVTNKEISVRTSQLRESAEVASGQDKLSGYELYDLVVLSGGGSANEVGVIVRVGREDFTVINNHGIAREVRPEELRGKRNSTSSRAVALDVQGNQIRVGDSVNVAEGPHKGKTATIKRMSRAQLFLHSQTRSEHAGIFVVRSRSCMLAGSKSQSRGAGMDAGVSPFATPQSQSHSGPAAGRGRKDDGLIGKTVRVRAGQWKGYTGIVTDSTATHVQVELHSRLKKVMVVRERVIVVGDKFGATENADQNGPVGIVVAPQTTMATPMHALGGATPAIHAFGGATPAHGDSETSDEVWRPGGSVDEAIKDDDGWGTSQNDPADANVNEDNDGGWGSGGGGSGNASSWGAPPQKKEEDGDTFMQQPKQEDNVQPSGLVKQEAMKNEMETEVADSDETPVWFMERVCVQLKENKQSAVIKEVNPDKSALVEMPDSSSRTVRVSEISMVPLVEHDTVLVTGGNEVGLEGSLVCVDGSDAILKDANDEFKIIDFVHLVKISSD